MTELETAVGHLDADARKILKAAIAAAAPSRLLAAALAGGVLGDPRRYRQVFVAACGKAAVPMAATLVREIGTTVRAGVVTAPDTGQESGDLMGLELLTASHPLPDQRSEMAAKRALEIARSAGEDDLLVVLISGGGSAMWTLPAESLTLKDLRRTVNVLLRAGADIHELNTVRRHLSAIKGGWMAVAAAPASVITLIISDVVGDDPGTVASGPTVPDPTTFSDALAVIDRRGGRGAYPPPVVDHLVAGSNGGREETPKPGQELFRKTSAHVIGSNMDALGAAARMARSLGYDTVVHNDPVTGEAREQGRRLARRMASVDGDHPTCLIWGGETTVTVSGGGTGGRNQELALAAAIELASRRTPSVLLSAGTDGIDGPTPAAGAVASPLTFRHAESLGVAAQEYLANNDSHGFFQRVGGLVITGPTQTNVMDIQIALMLGKARN